jgi:hypothetical protein
MTQTPLRNTSKHLLLQYFNTSTEYGAGGKAIEALTRYLSTNIAEHLRRGDRNLYRLMEIMMAEAESWHGEL